MFKIEVRALANNLYFFSFSSFWQIAIVKRKPITGICILYECELAKRKYIKANSITILRIVESLLTVYASNS